MANRDSVSYQEPTDPRTGDKILASSTQYLLSVLLVTMNERDSINTVMDDPDNYGAPVAQLAGVKDKTKEKEMQTTKAAIAPKQPVYASWINTIINNTADMVNTLGPASTKVGDVDCRFPYSTTIIEYQDEVQVPDQQSVDPVTGLGLVDASGNPIMVPGFRNPVPVLDSYGNPTYYTVTKKAILKEGPIVNTDVTDTAIICGNPSLVCPNRSRLYKWRLTASGDDPGYVNICNKQTRSEVHYYQTSIPNAVNMDNVNKGDVVRATTFSSIGNNLRLISSALDTYKSWWSGGLCARSCQVSCQRACMVSCQKCYGMTCHNQNCGSMS